MRIKLIRRSLALFLFVAMVSITGIMTADADATLNRTAIWNASTGNYWVHYDLYVTDGYINVTAWGPVYVWGFTDVDPESLNNTPTMPTIPTGALVPAGGPVGNAKFPAPVIEVNVTDDVWITVHNRGFYQANQSVQDDHTLHLHGIHAQTQYDGFPESVGGYTENLTTWWNATNPTGVITNALNSRGGICSRLNNDPTDTPCLGVYGTDTNFTYYFKAQHAGTYMYHCHVIASEHVQMGMYGGLIIRPKGFNPSDPSNRTIYGRVGMRQPDGMVPKTSTMFDKEYIYLLSEFDTNWHAIIETGIGAFYPPDFKPQLWFLNGKTFPDTLAPFRYQTPDNIREPLYDTYINVTFGQTYATRVINMGYQSQPLHQHGWHMNVMGTDAMQLMMPYMKYTVNVASGETYDTLTKAVPLYGATGSIQQGSPASSLPPSPGHNWRQIFPIHVHDDYKVTTNGTYPGGALGMIEGTGIPDVNYSLPTFENPYDNNNITVFPTPAN